MSAPGAEILLASKFSKNNNSELEVSNLVAGISGIICAPIVFALLAVVVCAFRAFKTTFQRLILYHIFIALLCECSFALEVQIDSSRSKQQVCVTAIYLYLYCILSWYIYTTAVTNYLFLLTIRLLRGNPNIWQHGKLAECFCVFFSLALPAAYVWIPIHDRTYQYHYCDKHSSTKWDKDDIILNIAILVLSLEVLMISFILCSLFCYLCLVYRAHQRQLTTLLKHFIYHMAISSVIVGFAILMSTKSLYRYHRHSSKSLSVFVHTVGAVVEPLVLLISAIFQTLLSIRHQNGQYCQKICKICCKFRCQVTQEQPYMDTDRNENQTNPPSNPLNQPSYTYFSVPYTGAFTQVTSDEHHQLLAEHAPLLRSDNKYSVIQCRVNNFF